jgi:PAS domain S-box-containing protein
MTSPSDFFSIFDHDKNFLEIMKRLLQASLEHSFTGIMITEAAQGYPIVYVNPAFCDMTGYGPQELLMKSPSILQGPKTDTKVLERLERDISSGRVFHGRAVNYRKDGSEFMMEWKIAPIRNAEGEISHYLAIQKDVSHSS